MNILGIRFFHQNNFVIKLLIILGVLVFSFFVGQYIPPKFLAYILILILGVGAMLLHIMNPLLGLLAIIAGGMLLKFDLGTGTGTRLNIVVILLPIMMGVWFVDRFVRQKEIRFVPSRTNPPIIMLVLASLLAFGIGQLTWFYYARQAPLLSQLAGLAIFILSAGAYIFTANVIGSIKQLKVLTWFFIAAGMVIVVSRVTPVIGGLIGGYLPRGATGSLFWVWLIAMMYSQLLVNHKLGMPVRFALLASIAATLFVAVYLGYNWKSGWIPPLVTIAAITWLKYPKLRFISIIGGLAAFGLIAAEQIQSDQYSYVTRLEAWRIVLSEIITVNPIFGLGPANYRFYTPLFPIMGYWVEFNSHNNYIDIIAQIGVFGLLAFLWFALEVWISGWGLIKKDLGGFGNAYVIGALGGLVGMLVAGMLGDWVIPFVYNVSLNGFRASVLGWILLGGLVALQHIYVTTQDNSEKAS